MSTVDNLLASVPIPRVVAVRQRFERRAVHDVERGCGEALRERRDHMAVKTGMRVAITAGSRGITNISEILRAVVAEVKMRKAVPFLVPAMGSHGGATAEGQVAVLAEMGVTEDTVGAPIVSSMDTVKIGAACNGLPVYADRAAYSADAIVLVNRIKPHIAFRGAFESGLLKMIAIGLGNQRGAEICHNLGFGRIEENILALATEALKHLPVVCGVAVLEDAYHDTAQVEVLLPEEIKAREPELLSAAKKLLPRLYVGELDALIMDEIGKNIAGSGFDTNVVGRFHTPYISRSDQDARITRIAALDLTDESHGNANGVGILDFISERLFRKIDLEQMYPNSLTSTVPLPVKIPMILKNDRQVIQAAIRTSNIRDHRAVRFARIKNTQTLETLEVSESLTSEIGQHPGAEVSSEPYDLSFDAYDNLV